MYIFIYIYYRLFWIEIHINFPLHQRNEMFGRQFAKAVDFVICCDGEDIHVQSFSKECLCLGNFKT